MSTKYEHSFYRQAMNAVKGACALDYNNMLRFNDKIENMFDDKNA